MIKQKRNQAWSPIALYALASRRISRGWRDLSATCNWAFTRRRAICSVAVCPRTRESWKIRIVGGLA
jgi:hypothetical protein